MQAKPYFKTVNLTTNYAAIEAANNDAGPQDRDVIFTGTIVVPSGNTGATSFQGAAPFTGEAALTNVSFQVSNLNITKTSVKVATSGTIVLYGTART